jgi:hypothetical protein
VEAGVLTVRASRVSRSNLLTAKRVAALAVATIALARLVAAWRLHGPVVMPDEYLYTAIGRSVAHGSWPVVRGGRFDFLPVLAPILQSPAWLIHDVGIAYRVVQAEDVAAMSAAALPAFALARRLELSERSAATAAVLAVLVPDLAYSGAVLSEPFAYPLFLAALLLAVDAIRAPSGRRQLLFVLAAGALCLTRLQFAFVPLVYLAAAAFATRPFRLPRFLREHRLVIAAFGLAAVAGVIGHGVAGRYGGLRSFSHAPGSIVAWTAANVLLLLITAGWAIVPGAALGLASLARTDDAGARAFAAVTVLTTLALVGEAGVFGAGLEQLEERYTFYAVPLLSIAFLLAVERGSLSRGAHAALSGLLLLASLFVPLDDKLFSAARDGSVALLVYVRIEDHARWVASLLVGLALLLIAVGTLVLARRGRAHLVVAAAAVIPLALSASLAFVLRTDSRVASAQHWHVPLPNGDASFLAFAGSTNPSDATTILFWNPAIRRVVVLGGKTVDGYASVPVHLVGGGRFADAEGHAVTGDLVFQSQFDTVETRGAPVSVDGHFGVVHAVERGHVGAVLVGWSSVARRLQPAGEVLVAAPRAGGTVDRTLVLRIHAPAAKGLIVRCSGGALRTLGVARPVELSLQGSGSASCRFAIDGVFHLHDGNPQTFSAEVALKAPSAPADR